MKDKITFDDFIAAQKVEIKYGQIIEVEEIPKSKKMYKLTVAFGETDIRTVVSSLKEKFTIEQLTGQSSYFVTNLEPRVMIGIESTAMLFPVTSNGDIKFIDINPGDELFA